MTAAPFAISRLAGHHDRTQFTCGVESLDRYFRQQASQDHRRRVANCFVLTDGPDGGAVAGYFTLSAVHLMATELPAEATRKLPRYPEIPAVLIGRLAIATRFQGQRLGEALLAEAIDRAARADIANFVIVVDPIDDNAKRFYERFGFATLPGSGPRMFITVETALRVIANP